MKIYDISQEIFSCEVYPGDDIPIFREDKRISRGDAYNLSSFSMCSHNGTHIDAPYHFFDDRKKADELDLEKCIGKCFVFELTGKIDAEGACKILSSAQQADPESSKRILIKGDAEITADAARVFADANVFLVGCETQSVGDSKSPAEVHKILLEKEVVLLEGIRLQEASSGVYFLFAAPLKLSGFDGAPCRAILVDI